MDFQVSAFDLHFIVRELREHLIDARIDKFYQPDKKEILMNVHVPGKGKHMLKINLPKVLYLTEYKEEMPQQPLHFCVVLRKYLGGAFLREINQLGFERILDFVFDCKDGKKHLVLEFFSKGNAFLTDENYVIKSLIEPQKWKDRTLRGNVEYEYPKRDHNPLTIEFDSFTKVIDESDKESIVKTLALDLGLGGKYAEEVCFRAGLDKDQYYSEEKEKKALYDALAEVKDETIAAYSDVKSISPIVFKSIEKKEVKEHKSFNSALDEVLAGQLIQNAHDRKVAPFEKKKKQFEKQIAQQEQQIAKLEKDSVDFQEKGELIYNNYTKIDPILSDLKEIIKKYSQKEIKEKLKDHPVIKEINFKEKTVQLELE